MTKLKQTLYSFLVYDCKRGERWLLFFAAILAIAARQSTIPEESLVEANIIERAMIETTIETEVLSKSDSLLLLAQSLIGVPYRYAGKNRNGFDCSGFTSYVFDKVGIDIAASSRRQFVQGQPIGLSDVLPGDLIFFRGGQKVSHVGIITEAFEDSTYFIHSSSSRGVVIDQLETNYYLTRLAGIRRVITS